MLVVSSPSDTDMADVSIDDVAVVAARLTFNARLPVSARVFSAASP